MNPTDIINSLKLYVQNNYGGDMQKAFNAYADSLGHVSEASIVRFLTDAKVSWGFARTFIANQVLRQLDPNNAGYITWDECEQYLKENSIP